MGTTRFGIATLTVLFLLVSGQFSYGQAIYSYSGSTFTTASGPFVGESVSGTVTLSAVPGPGTVNVIGTPLGGGPPTIDAFSFTADGVTIDPSNADTFSVISLTFEDGLVTDWNIALTDENTFATILSFYDSGSGTGFDFAADDSGSGEVNANPDGWELLDDEVIPEPTSLAIWSMIAGIGVVVGWSRSRKRKACAAS